MDKLLVSVSGGRTSAYMSMMIWDQMKYSVADIRFVFANTGKEHPDTLRFLHDFEVNTGIPVVWVEAVVNPEKGQGTRHKIVDFDTASRNGEPYRAVIEKYGVPNVRYCHCNREMKLQTITSFCRSIGWSSGDYHSAIGIRADENRRVSKDAVIQNIIYPLVDIWPTEKEDVIDYMAMFDWDLKIPEHLGNCTTCFKKSDKKLKMVHQEMPNEFDFNREMESAHSMIRGVKSVFFRGGRSTEQLIDTFEFIGDIDLPDAVLEGGCSESCEIYQMELI